MGGGGGGSDAAPYLGGIQELYGDYIRSVFLCYLLGQKGLGLRASVDRWGGTDSMCALEPGALHLKRPWPKPPKTPSSHQSPLNPPRPP